MDAFYYVMMGYGSLGWILWTLMLVLVGRDLSVGFAFKSLLIVILLWPFLLYRAIQRRIARGYPLDE